jgi:hypothetical protein
MGESNMLEEKKRTGSGCSSNESRSEDYGMREGVPHNSVSIEMF